MGICGRWVGAGVNTGLTIQFLADSIPKDMKIESNTGSCSEFNR